jgi:hypothetical protein
LGDSPEEGIKAPVATTADDPITLAGLQTIGGVTLAAGTRVLVRGQVDPTENGIYTAAETAWSRAVDFNAADDVANGVLVLDSNTKSIYQTSFEDSWRPNITEVTFNLVIGAGVSGDVYVPLSGTVLGKPITASLQHKSTGQDWRAGIFGSPIAGYYIKDQSPDIANVFGIVVNGKNTLINGKGQVLVDTVYDGTVPDNALVTKSYMASAIAAAGGGGGGGAGYVPLAGTATGYPITGPLTFANADLDLEWVFGILPTVTDSMTLAPGSGNSDTFILATGSSVTTQWWAFNANGQVTLPDIDYSAAADLSLVSKAYVDAVAAGEGGAYIPLAGTTAGAPLTGVIHHRDYDLEMEVVMGIEGITNVFTIAPGVNNNVDCPILIVTENAAGTQQAFGFGADGYITVPDIDYSAADDLNLVSKAYVDAAAASGGGAYIPLIGTGAGDPVSGLVRFEDTDLSMEFNVGLNALLGDGGFVIAATSASSENSAIYFVTGSADYITAITKDGGVVTTYVETTADLDVGGVGTFTGILYANAGLNTTGIIASAGALIGGNITGGGNLELATGKVGIGGAINPSFALSVYGAASISGGVNTAGITCTGIIASSNIAAPSMTFSASQSAAVNSATRKDYVDGLNASNVKTSGNQTIGGVKIFSSPINCSGIPALSGSTVNAVWGLSTLGYATSDARLKEDIVGCGYGLDTILALEPVSFKWRATGEEDAGFIAQQVQAVIPEAVPYVTDDEMFAYKDTPIVAALVKAVQELSAKVDALTA